MERSRAMHLSQPVPPPQESPPQPKIAAPVLFQSQLYWRGGKEGGDRCPNAWGTYVCLKMCIGYVSSAALPHPNSSGWDSWQSGKVDHCTHQAEEIRLSKGQVPSGHLKPAGLPASCPLHPLNQAPLRPLWPESTYLGLGGCFLHV